MLIFSLALELASLIKQKTRKRFQKLYRNLRPMRREYRKRFRKSLRQWLLYHQDEIVFDKCYWMGVRALKNPLDAWIYQEIIYEVKPDVIIEIGSAEGGGTLYFANLLDLIGHGMVISIDIDRTRFNVKHDRIVTFTGDSASPEIIAKVSEQCIGKTVMVVHDGEHSREQVSKDLSAYSKLVSLNSYIIVEDGLLDLFHPRDSLGGRKDGPLVAVEQFLKTDNNFVIDKERERYILTYNPKGYLKRIR